MLEQSDARVNLEQGCSDARAIWCKSKSRVRLPWCWPSAARCPPPPWPAPPPAALLHPLPPKTPSKGYHRGQKGRTCYVLCKGCVKLVEEKKPLEAAPGASGWREGLREASDKLPWRKKLWNSHCSSWPVCELLGSSIIIISFLILMISVVIDTL